MLGVLLQGLTITASVDGSLCRLDYQAANIPFASAFEAGHFRRGHQQTGQHGSHFRVFGLGLQFN